VNVNVKNNYDDTPLMVACRNNREDVALILLNYPGVDVNIIDKGHDTALTLCNKDTMPRAYAELVSRTVIAKGGMSHRVRRNKSKKHHKRRSKKTKRHLRKSCPKKTRRRSHTKKQKTRS